ncbi:hypothetical protein BBO99_00002363 [Phytophthora kernoviae]|uniref:START domain-containing protein n=2 Tax=Phytophthora kernoviae TaxID=325452 RepID=A0A3R7G3L8_9STRA|nr:hypothetical protein G195_002857 [Phytophthora kernoviae 00238/432]KAG2530440.1 hypothetical protein JM18_002141 [Phytophthora kernoviae]RLN31326.1 hypothetical protein BBI17_002265 [Phytophthora kernoviae]RLN83165.1 hypothetical protein BBO99_00002363 [Phytophthora kernoviae]
MPTRFPLPAGYFGDVELSATKRQEYHEVVRSRVSTMLADEIRYAERRDQQHPIVPVTEWKAKPPIGELNVYQRRRRGRSNSELAEDENFPEGKSAVTRGNASIVANGRVKGSIEDMLYGMSATTQGDMMTGLAYTAPPKDCVLLGVVEQATAEDPLHSAELLWVLTKIPLIKQRDVCYLKATGVEYDRDGRYGYLVMHSVDLQECPPFDSAAKVVRAKMFFACLFRERAPGHVDVVARGIFDLSGNELLKVLLKGATAGKPTSSVGVTTSSTFDGSCTSFEFADARYSGTLSDLDSDSYGFRDDGEQEKEPEPSQTVLPELMKEFATIDSPLQQPASARGMKAWDERHRFNPDDFTRPAAQKGVDDRRRDPPPAKPRPDNLYEWMKDLQSSANEAYIMTQVSGEIMKKSMR